MTIEELKALAIEALNDLKAIDLMSIDIRGLTTIADFMIVCTGRSNVHVKSLAENVIKKAKECQAKFIKSEGEREGEWVIVDLADVVIHVMLPATRSFYSLEDLWEPNVYSHTRHRQ
jgi:ribosome-associated protein